MSIETAFERVSEKIADSYRAVKEKGGILPPEKKIANLERAILSIPAGDKQPDPQWYEINMKGDEENDEPLVASASQEDIEAWKLFDGDYKTSVVFGEADQTPWEKNNVVFDFGRPAVISGYRLTREDRSTVEYVLQGSNDRENWEEIDVGTIDKRVKVGFPAPVTYRYVRLIARKNVDGVYLSDRFDFSELEFKWVYELPTVSGGEDVVDAYDWWSPRMLSNTTSKKPMLALPVLQEKTVELTQSPMTIVPDDGYDALSMVTVEGSVNGTIPADPKLQAKTVTPTESTQVVKPDDGYDGLSQTTVNRIPDIYKDTSDATAGPDDILEGKTAYVKGEKVTGTGTVGGDSYEWWSPGMVSNTEGSGSISGGSGSADPKLQEKTSTPTESDQRVVPDSGYDGLSAVNVKKIPDKYKDTSDATAGPDDILEGKTAYVKGEKVTGTGTVGSGGSTPAEPKLQEKSVTPTASTQEVTPDASYDGLSKVTVSGDTNLKGDNIKQGVSIFGVDGTYQAATGGSGSGDIKLQMKTVIPSSFEQTVKPDLTYDGLSQVTVMAIPEEPVNSEFRWWSPNMSSNTTPAPYQLFGTSKADSYKIFDNDTNTSYTMTDPVIGFDFGIPVKVSGIKVVVGGTNISKVVVSGNNTGPNNDFEEIVSKDFTSDEGTIGTMTITFTAISYRYIRFGFSTSSGTPTVSDITFYREFILGNTKLQEKTVSPATTAQEVVPDGPYDGLSKVTVAAATLQNKSVTPTETAQTVTPDAGFYGLSQVNVAAAPKTTPNLQTKTVDPAATSTTVSPDSGYDGLSSVTVNAPKLQTLTVDPKSTSQTVNPTGDNIGLSQVIVNAVSLQSKTATPSASSQTVTADSSYTGLSQVTVNAVSLQSKTVTPTTSRQTITADSSYTGLSQVIVNAAEATTPKLQSKTATPSTSSQIIRPDSSYDGLSQVTVNAAPLTTKTVTPSASTQTLTPTSSYVGFSSVTVNPVPDSLKGAGTITLNIAFVNRSSGDNYTPCFTHIQYTSITDGSIGRISRMFTSYNPSTWINNKRYGYTIKIPHGSPLLFIGTDYTSTNYFDFYPFPTGLTVTTYEGDTFDTITKYTATQNFMRMTHNTIMYFSSSSPAKDYTVNLCIRTDASF